ncbi:MAG TPA: hypothetical protein VND20_09160 [Candidatus Binataceae bacterium]|nr:hypothetical protein [Candidatus Binataceae bacterium]HVC44973.1 hypothetical protein [Candidatus Binataceae bacterium]
MHFIERISRPRGFAIVLVALASFSVVSVAGRALADDDWDVVTPNTAPSAGASAAPSARHHHASADAPAAAAGVVIACGEEATAPSAKVATIVSQINQAWGSDVHVYQSVAPEGPHARPGGCIFYNGAEMVDLIGGRLDVREANVVEPMLYAIFAHEVGHENHGDFDPSRAAVPNQTKELEADRFAGYTMRKLGVPATGLAPYWSMTGDEFGRGSSHGTSTQRVDAFKEGWHLAQWNRTEDSQPVATAGQESVAPDDASDDAP